jgi:hypothetical protein
LLRRLAAGQRTFRYLSTFVIHITSGAADFYDSPNHETASQFVGQRKFSAKYSAGKLTDRVSLEASQLYGLLLADPLQWGRAARVLRERVMKKLVFAILLISSPAWAQTKLLPKSATARVDNCAPIGRTEDGKLVYSMKCENLPVPTPPPPQAETRDAPAPEPEVQRSGIFGLSYERKKPGE